MFSIPKLAKGGLLTPPKYAIIGDDYENKDVPPLKFIDKYHVIYNRTKKARIKKKAFKKSWVLQAQEQMKNPITITIGTETKIIEV